MTGIAGLLGEGVASTALDVDNALYMTSMSQAVEEKESKALIFWGIAVEYAARVGIAALALTVFTGDETLFSVGDTKVTPVMVAMLVAGLFLFCSNLKDLGDFLIGADDEQAVTSMSFGRALFEMSVVNVILSLDTVIAVTGEVTNVAAAAVVLSVSSIIRVLFVRQIAGFMAANPSLKIVTGGFLILIGLSLILQGLGTDFPEEGFGIGLVIAVLLMWAYDELGPRWFARQLGEDEPAVTDADADDSAERSRS